MKKIILLSLLSLITYANSNPQIRTCRLVQGNFEVYDIEFDEIGHCNLGKASIDTISLMFIRHEGVQTRAVESFLADEKTCSSITLEGVNTDRTNTLCYYMDGSSIDLETLQKGRDHVDNRRLTAILSK